MDIFYGKRHFKEYMIEQIIELFIHNYIEYHYEKMRNYEGIKNLIKDEQFDCVFIVDENKICGFAGYYLKSELQDEVKEVSLAHLLVDINSRGKGYGNVLEDCRLEMIHKMDGDKVIYASCVEKPCSSVKMKQKRGFYTGGFRYHYRPGKEIRDNAVIMVHSSNLQREIHMDSLCHMTEKILKRGNPNIRFNGEEYSEGKYLLEVKDSEQLGRRICHIAYSVEDGRTIGELDLSQIKKDYGYVGVYVRPSIKGFKVIDDLLVENCFYPISYIPYINDGYGMLEYQYLPEGIQGVLKDEEILEGGREVLSYLIL